MRKILKLNNTAILNFDDLKDNFLPLPLFEKIGVFSAFSRVHCVSLPTIIQNQSGEKSKAVYLTKAFWQSLIDDNEWAKMPEEPLACFAVFCEQRLNEETSYLVDDKDKQTRRKSKAFIRDIIHRYVQALLKTDETVPDVTDKLAANDKAALKDFLGKNAQEENNILSTNRVIRTLNAFKKEYTDLKVREKIEYIAKQTACGNDCRRVLQLLAICELAEKDALVIEPESWQKAVLSTDTGNTDSVAQVKPFTATETAHLMCGTIYRYPVCEEKTLPQGQLIRTVKMQAMHTQSSEPATVELYSQKDKNMVERFKVYPMQDVYVTALGDTIIHVLPDSVEGSDVSIRSRQGVLTIMPVNEEEWTAEYFGVSSFDIDNYQSGFLAVANGKLVTLFYDRVNKDYELSLRLNSIVERVVEVKAQASEFLILLETGEMLSTENDDSIKGVLRLS